MRRGPAPRLLSPRRQAGLWNDAVRPVEHDDPVAPRDPDERHVESPRALDREFGRGRDRDQRAGPEGRGLLDHLERGPARHEDEARGRVEAAAQASAHHLVERVVTADILAHDADRAVETRPGGAMDRAGRGVEVLAGVERREGTADRRERDAGGFAGRRGRARQGREVVDTAEPATRSPRHGPLAGEMMPEALGRDLDREAHRASGGLDRDAADLMRRRDDALGQGEAIGEILEVVGRRHHDAEGQPAE